ncbi:MAG: hypothetical protein WAZ18_02295 [Alphaproteobacteria bacterium]
MNGTNLSSPTKAFIPGVRDLRVCSGLRERDVYDGIYLSRGSLMRIERDEGVSLVTAYAYLKCLKGALQKANLSTENLPEVVMRPTGTNVTHLFPSHPPDFEK